MQIPLPPLWRLTLLLLLVASSAHAQQATQSADLIFAPLALTPSQTQPAASASSPSLPTHRFWDRENDWLFAAVGAGRGLDYASTLNMRRRGITEIFLTNSIVD